MIVPAIVRAGPSYCYTKLTVQGDPGSPHLNSEAFGRDRRLLKVERLRSKIGRESVLDPSRPNVGT
jgi:hypothetical protein